MQNRETGETTAVDQETFDKLRVHYPLVTRQGDEPDQVVSVPASTYTKVSKALAKRQRRAARKAADESRRAQR